MRLAARTRRSRTGSGRRRRAAARAPATSGRSRARACSRASRRRRARRSAAGPARAARSGCPCGRSSRSPRAPARGRRPCRRGGAGAGRRAAGRPARPRRRARRRSPAPSRARSTPVILATTSFRLSTCCTLSVGVDVDARVEQLLARPASAWRGASRARWCAPARRPARAWAGGRAPRRGRTPAAGCRGTPWRRRGRTSRSLEERLGLDAAVGLDPADDHVHALRPLLAGGLEHRVGLADAGGGAEEDLELAACLAGFRLLDTGQQLVGIRATLGAHQSARRQPTPEEPRDSTTTASRYRPRIKKASKSARRPLDVSLMRRRPVLRRPFAWDR